MCFGARVILWIYFNRMFNCSVLYHGFQYTFGVLMCVIKGTFTSAELTGTWPVCHWAVLACLWVTRGDGAGTNVPQLLFRPCSEAPHGGRTPTRLPSVPVLLLPSTWSCLGAIQHGRVLILKKQTVFFCQRMTKSIPCVKALENISILNSQVLAVAYSTLRTPRLRSVLRCTELCGLKLIKVGWSEPSKACRCFCLDVLICFKHCL